MTPVAATQPDQITIRLADDHDAPALLTLAQLDSAPVPAEPAVLAEAGGEPRVALSLRDGHAVADPFFPSAHLVALLRMHATQLEDEHGRGTRRRRRMARAPALSPARAS
jgi:hypothetical protein